MSHRSDDHPEIRYDRDFVLFGPRRDAVLELREVERFGRDSYGNDDHVAVYGMLPAQWYARGIRLLGRTVVECTRDRLADAVAVDVAALATLGPAPMDVMLLDPFAGSGNTLYWLQRRLLSSSALGFELDHAVCDLTTRNLAIVDAPVEVVNVDYAEGLASVAPSDDQLVVVFIGPPWGHGFHPTSGLDLRRTEPPVAEIVDALIRAFPRNPLLLAVQSFERLAPDSLAETAARFDWSAHHVYDLNPPGFNPGLLLGTKRWAPGGSA